MIDCNEWRTEKRHECANMRKVKRLELWWQLYRTSLPVWDLENFRLMDFCWHECTWSFFGKQVWFTKSHIYLVISFVYLLIYYLVQRKGVLYKVKSKSRFIQITRSLALTYNALVSQGRIKLFGAPRQWKHFRPLFQAVFLSGGGINPPRLSQTLRLPVPRQK